MNPEDLDNLMAEHGWFPAEVYNSPIARYYRAENVSTDKAVMIRLLELADVRVSGNTGPSYIRIPIWT